METKRCSKCGEIKPVSEFYKKCDTKDGYTLICKGCSSLISKEYQEKNKTKIKIQRKEKYIKNRDKILKKQKEYSLKHKDKINSYGKEYRKRNQEKIKQSMIKWSKDNKEHKAQYMIEYGKSNRERISKYAKNKYREDINYKISCNVRSRIRVSLKASRINKNNTTMELIGCTFQFVHTYIEAQFIEGMSWNNYGKWHIDHIRPCASFDLTDPEQQKQCFHYTNLQPLWAEDNLRKSDKWESQCKN